MKPTPTPPDSGANPYAAPQEENWSWLFSYGVRIPRRQIVTSHLALISVYGIAGTLGCFLFSLSNHFADPAYPILTLDQAWDRLKVFTFIGTALSLLGLLFSLVVNGRNGLKPHVGALFLLFLGTFPYVSFCILIPEQPEFLIVGFSPRVSIFVYVGTLFWVPWLFTCCIYWVVAGWIAGRMQRRYLSNSEYI